jgi:hypothetical protein
MGDSQCAIEGTHYLSSCRRQGGDGGVYGTMLDHADVSPVSKESMNKVLAAL